MSTEIDRLADLALNMRKRMLKISLTCGQSTHLGGGLSLVEIIATLYGEILNVNPTQPELTSRDRFILSKGHGVLAYFAGLAEVGFINEEKFATFMQNDSDLIAHPILNLKLGIESSNGSLGQGLSFGVGLAWGARAKQESHRIYVVLGDGECNEGAVWEAALSAAHLKLTNLTAVVDSNSFQSDGNTSDVLSTSDLASKWRSFGWHVFEIDGHNISELLAAFREETELSRPKLILANTVKGKGISFMENNNSWHHARLTQNFHDQALNELEVQ